MLLSKFKNRLFSVSDSATFSPNSFGGLSDSSNTVAENLSLILPKTISRGGRSNSRDRQLTIFSRPNPLQVSLFRDFFKNIPQKPGVYFMRDEKNEVLYIGKAKNLKDRLHSYKYAKEGTVSRKVLQMIEKVRSIEVEICRSEKRALMRENLLLQEHRPPFNVINTSPEFYSFLILEREEFKFQLSITSDHPVGLRDSQRAFGAFKR